MILARNAGYNPPKRSVSSNKDHFKDRIVHDTFEGLVDVLQTTGSKGWPQAEI